MKAKVIVLSGKSGSQYEFQFKLHKSTQIGELQIEPIFYEKWAKIPKGTHYETEIIYPDIQSFPHSKKIHFHTSELNKKDFICWIGQVPIPQGLSAVIDMWCVGTVYTIETGEDFATLFELHKIDTNFFDPLIDVLEKEYDISIYYHYYNFN